MMSNIRVRRSVAADVPALVALNNTVWTETNSPHVAKITEAEYAERHPVGGEWVADVDGRLAGYIVYRPPTRMESNAHVAELAIAVHPDFQGRGVGRLLVETACREAKAEGKRKLSLRVMSTNEQAIRFYEKLGFREQGRLVEEFYAAGRYVDDVLMYKMLE
ncbi:GNAT family N-acetyltransferase [Paenibacillus sp.]|uniref:GNAT family N-acetyltransferase n=1 Tax=Paenibacillus sp. TaxID=58172 RepID=UPI002D4FD77E|nr:GNAT family N-acetyltransferase [Paenibacillus sp.]HZG55711.1 GNAT family N-acetyltransferase [Paenibacillus sp.]